MTAVIAVDLGGTTLKAALVDAEGRSRASAGLPTFPGDGGTPLSQLLRLLDILRTEADRRGMTVVGAGIVVPGIVLDSGVVAFAANIGWRDLPLKQIVEEHLKMPVAVSHDVNSSGIAESLFGAGRGQSHFVMLTIGTGIAAVLMSGGQLIRGVANGAGELGHVPIFPDGEMCACGQRGCLEAYASAASIARRYQLLGGTQAKTAAEIGASIDSDPLAAQVWADAVRGLSLGLATATLMMDPALLVLGGGLAQAGAVLIEPVQKALQALLVWRSAPPIALSLVGTAAGRIGAAVLGYRACGLGSVVDGWTLDAVLDEPSEEPLR